MRKPFYKKSHKAWYVHDNGKLKKLGRTEEEANKEWAAMLTTQEPAAPQATGLTLGELVDRFLAWVKRHRAEGTYLSYRNCANRWKAMRSGKGTFADIPAATIRGHHVTELCTADDGFSEFAGFGDSSRWQAQKTAAVMFAWAKSEGLLDVNPLLGYRKSAKCGVRDKFITHTQFETLLAACDDPDFADLITCLWDTGARPFELFQATAAHLDRAEQLLVFKKVGGKGDKVKSRQLNAVREVILSKRAFEIVCRLADRYPAGPLFRNQAGNRYTNSGCSRRFAALGRKSGVKTTLYEFRHGWAHHHVTVKKTDIITLAAMGGWTNVKMLATIYAHAAANRGHMRAAAG